MSEGRLDVLHVDVPGGILTDRARAHIVRMRYLEEPLPRLGASSRPLACDLNGLRILTAESADELVAKFVEDVQTRQRRVVVVVARSSDVLSAVNAALRDRKRAAFAVHATSESSDWLVPRPIGFVTKSDREMLEAIRSAGPSTPGRFEETSGIVQAEQRLTDLLQRGLLSKRGAEYVYPLPSSEEIRAEVSPADSVLTA